MIWKTIIKRTNYKQSAFPFYQALIYLIFAILSLFSTDEFRRFVSYLPETENHVGGKVLIELLYGVGEPPAKVISSAIEMFHKNDVIDDDLFNLLIETRPRRKLEILQLKTLYDECTKTT